MERVLKSAAKVLHFFAVCWASTPKKDPPCPSLKRPSKSPLKGDFLFSPFKGEVEGVSLSV